jgi:hypothetical protein
MHGAASAAWRSVTGCSGVLTTESLSKLGRVGNRLRLQHGHAPPQLQQGGERRCLSYSHRAVALCLLLRATSRDCTAHPAAVLPVRLQAWAGSCSLSHLLQRCKQLGIFLGRLRLAAQAGLKEGLLLPKGHQLAHAP